jgi:hypothetical protein
VPREARVRQSSVWEFICVYLENYFFTKYVLNTKDIRLRTILLYTLGQNSREYGRSVEFGPSRFSPKRSWGARGEVVGAYRDPPEEKGVQ